MVSCALASLFLKFLPMLPIQILLNNLLYDISELTIPTDNVDSGYIEKPKRWDMSFVRKFMVYLGPISSIFDLLTFLVLLIVFNAAAALFQTGWFIESLVTQALVIFVIRTRLTPFYKSKPSRFLVLSTFGVVTAALILPFTPLGEVFKFVIPPAGFFVFLVGFVCAYLVLVEVVKKWFYKQYVKD
jgi:Mg2+-importing ATPase